MRSAAISRHQQSSLANSECVVIRFVTSKFRMFGHQVRHEQTPNVWSSDVPVGAIALHRSEV